jgi:parallel beta-helix repeat protein
MLDGGGDLTTLIQLNGATGVTLQGLTFQNTNLSGRAAVVLNGASGNRIVGNHFAHNGEGLLLDNNSNRNVVSGNELNNSASSAVEVQQGSSNNRFDSNLVNGTGAIGTKGGGFFLHGANNNVISHNLVENTAGIGIGIENWDSNTVNVGNSITNNIVQNSNTSSQSTDSGAIYELGRSQVDTKSVISGNYISGPNTAASSGAHIVGIYLDDYTDGVQVTNNIVANTVTHAVQIHGGHNVTVQNNIFDLGANGKSAILFQSTGASATGTPLPMTNDVVTQNIIASTSSSPTAFDNISGGSPTINNNFFMDLINSNFQTNGLAQTNAHFGNAQFANEAGGNYALGSNSGATAIGFVPINQASMGLHATTAHWYA